MSAERRGVFQVAGSLSIAIVANGTVKLDQQKHVVQRNVILSENCCCGSPRISARAALLCKLCIWLFSVRSLIFRFTVLTPIVLADYTSTVRESVHASIVRTYSHHREQMFMFLLTIRYSWGIIIPCNTPTAFSLAIWHLTKWFIAYQK